MQCSAMIRAVSISQHSTASHRIPKDQLQLGVPANGKRQTNKPNIARSLFDVNHAMSPPNGINTIDCEMLRSEMPSAQYHEPLASGGSGEGLSTSCHLCERWRIFSFSLFQTYLYLGRTPSLEKKHIQV